MNLYAAGFCSAIALVALGRGEIVTTVIVAAIVAFNFWAATL